MPGRSGTSAARDMGVDLSHPTLPSVTDFFLSLHDEVVIAETILGYHPARDPVFRYSDCSMFDSPEIAALLKNFTLEQPLWFQEVPQWNLPLALSFPFLMELLSSLLKRLPCRS